MNKTLVIAVAGASGSGKSTLIKTLARQFACPSLHFDDFVEKQSYPDDMNQWLDGGAAVTDIKTPLFTKAIRGLLKQNDQKMLLIEEPFAKARQELKPLISLSVYLDVPLALCLARVMERRLKCASALNKGQLLRYLANYQSTLFKLYNLTNEQAKHSADLILNNNVEVDIAATQIKTFIEIENKKREIYV